MTAPPAALVTVPVTAPGATGRMKLAVVVWPTVTVAVSVCDVKPVAEVVRVWLPGASPERGEIPEALVVAVGPPLSLTVALAIAAPPEPLVIVPLGAPVVGVRMKLTFGVVWPPVTVAVSVWGANWLAEAVRLWLPGAGEARL